MSVDGLAALQAKRNLATSSRSSSRHLPPARNAPKTAKPAAEQTTSMTGISNTDQTVAPPSQSASPTSVEPPASRDELVRATIYLLPTDDDWFDDIARAARTRRPRVDASRSAVARLALARLRETLSAEDIVNILKSRAQNSDQTSGRKRL